MTAKDINELFRKAGRTLGSVESFTGGLFASEITKIPGASHFFKGAIITYATEEKVRLLGIPYSDVDLYGVVSKEIATQMAEKGAKKLDVDYCVSFTGNAGPDVMENKPAGRVYIAVSAYGKSICQEFNLKGDREAIQQQSCEIAYKMLSNMLKEIN